MLSLFKKQPAPEQSPTLKTRVGKFWEWYTEVAPRFYATIEAGKCASLAEEVSAKIHEIFPGFAWVFGPGENKQGHSFTFSGEGVFHRQLIALYWLGRAPTLPGWTFYAARQPGPIKGHTIEMGGRKFDSAEIWLTTSLDRDREKIDITAWHHSFKVLERQQQFTILYLFLDEILGEYGTDLYLGKIELGDEKLADAIPLFELHDFVEGIKATEGWKKYPPGGCYTGYKCEPHDRFLRGDVFTGTTACFKIVADYLDAEGELADPLKSTGADYIFVAFDVSILPQGKQVDARGDIEEDLDQALGSEKSGRVLGGALGTKSAYIDIMIYDGANSLEIVKQVLHDKKLPAGTEIHYFAKEKRGHRVVL